MDNLEEMDKFIEKYNFEKLKALPWNQEQDKGAHSHHYYST